MDACSFIERELLRLEDNIERLERSLQRYASDDPMRAGNAALLAIQRQQRDLVRELRPAAPDAEGLLLTCYELLRVVQQKHRVLTLNGAARDLCHADHWWATLDGLQYLSDLTSRLNTYIRHGASGGTGFDDSYRDYSVNGNGRGPGA